MVLSFVSVFLVFLSIGLSWCATTPTPQDDGGFRNLWQFGNMIKFTTNRSPFDFINYGCYCGWGGSGNPVDDLDRCCKVHDECYGKHQTLFCRPKLVTYSWKKVLNKVVCYKGFFDGDCDLNVCKCDRDAAHCFASAAYNDEYNKMDQSVCRQ